MATTGTVREFHPDKGLGVIDSTEVPGGCWTSFAVIDMEGFRELIPGQAVSFRFEPVADQDGYGYVATWVRPQGSGAAPEADGGPSSAYGSAVRIHWDDAP